MSFVRISAAGEAYPPGSRRVTITQEEIPQCALES